MWKEFKITALAWLFLQSSIFPLEITSFETKKCLKTKCDKRLCTETECKKTDVEFSKSFVVDNIKFMQIPAGNYIQMPLTIRKNGRKKVKYSNIKIKSRMLYDKLVKSFEGRPSAEPAEKEIEDVNFRVISARKLNSDFRVSNIDVIFDNELIVTFGLLKKTHPILRNKIPAVYFEVSNPQNFRFKSERLKTKIDKLVMAEGLKAAKKNDMHK